MNYLKKVNPAESGHLRRILCFNVRHDEDPSESNLSGAEIYYESFLRGFIPDPIQNSDNPKVFGTIYIRDFLTFLWLWHGFHLDKKFIWPIIAEGWPDGYMHGGNHRFEVVYVYNLIFESNHTIDIVGPNLDGEESSYEIKSRPRPGLDGNGFPFNDKLYFPGHNWSPVYEFEKIKELVEYIRKDIWQYDMQFEVFDIHQPFYDLKDKTKLSKIIYYAMISCILLKIPVESKYFSLSFK